MNEGLLDAVRHNVWATKHLLAFCGDLPEDRVAAPSRLGFGSILATCNHLVGADGRYLRRLVGDGPAWLDDDRDVGLAELAARVDELEPLWERFLAEPIDVERVIVVDRGANEVRAGIFVAQALHHGNAHREQVCGVLTELGIEPPDVQPWEYAWATGRLWERRDSG